MQDIQDQEFLSVFARVNSISTEAGCIFIIHGQADRDRLELPQTFEMARTQSRTKPRGARNNSPPISFS